ncbi:acetylserotonin O-methyltransferase 1-like [Phragmites australis]|uniref:acetylserotonin O-methyltransferase 1-like n=1 Tax=Phragmites australis TaxID=29695 RepID=UPI002D78AA2B|nr:acetylserotonin O-methyltransferase 1-like [Phragmites australis]
MSLRLLAEVSPQDLLVALSELQNHLLGYVKSMALKCAVDLGIPDAIHRRGGAATLANIATDTAVHPAKVPDLQRVMELLSTSGIFSTTAGEDSGESGAVVYGLTTACRFLVGWRNLSPIVPFFVSPLIVSSFFSMGDWFRSEPAAAGSLFELAHGCSQWEMASKDAALNSVLNDSMVADSELFLEVIILDKGRIFRGLSSLVDVGGGNGAGTQVIARAFPRIKCTVLDLPHVVGQVTAGDGKLHFIAGDMFESIPPADAVLLKNILHEWGDDDCVKILRRCKEAIPARSAGGKVIIIEMVRGSALGDSRISEMEALQNMFMMYVNGVERGENEWKKIFSDAGFSDDYKIMPILGPLSVIEIYP